MYWKTVKETQTMRKLGLIALLCILCIGGAASAQSAMPVFCGTLSTGDCTILTNAHTATQTLDSLSFDMTLNETISNMPQTTQPMTFNITGNGSLTGLSSLRADAMNMMTAATAGTTQFNPSQLIQDVLTKLGADLTLNVSLPAGMMPSTSKIPSSITLQVRLVNGVGYVNFDSLPAMLNPGHLTGWGGVDLASLMPLIMQQMQKMPNMSSSNMSSMQSMMQQFQNPDFLSKFISIQRTDNGSGSTATFEYTVDLGALMSSPEFQTMMQTQMQAQAQAQGMTQAQMQQMQQMEMQMFQGMKVVVDEEIGLSDSFIHSVHSTATIDMGAMMAAASQMMSGTATPVANTPAPTVSVDFTMNFSNFNSVPAITA